MKKILSIIIVGLLGLNTVYGQGGLSSKEQLLGQRNVITTAVPFLLISPDSRAAGMGDLGAATTPDAASIHWNPGKLAFVEGDGGVSLSAAPWLRQLVPDVWLYYLSGYYKLDKRSTVAGSLRYFTLGDIQFTDQQGQSLGNYNPNELALDLAYSTKLSKKLSLGVAMRFVYSDLARGQISGGAEIRAGVGGAGDLGGYWNDKMKINGKKVTYSIGASVNNIGNKITYTTEANRDFVPVNMRLGTFWKTQLDEYNEIGIGVDFNKLLVPTPQYIYEEDSFGNRKKNSEGYDIIKNRVIDDGPVLQGMFSSFGDAPGGLREELKEINMSIGLEYWYDKQFALRVGYFNEADTKGGRKFATFGVGLKYQVFTIDAAYLQPFQRRHPLQNTIRFTLGLDLNAFKNQSKEK